MALRAVAEVGSMGAVGGEDNAEEDEGSHRSVLISFKRVGLFPPPLDTLGVFEGGEESVVVAELILAVAEVEAAAAARLRAAIPEGVVDVGVVVVVFEALEVEGDAFAAGLHVWVLGKRDYEGEED
ncbi:hypothetical protein FRC17_005005 [Serendipita sp. 399]|nr:hypothetical protein FRC17_005005 [Serendipita sp. 399]